MCFFSFQQIIKNCPSQFLDIQFALISNRKNMQTIKFEKLEQAND